MKTPFFYCLVFLSSTLLIGCNSGSGPADSNGGSSKGSDDSSGSTAGAGTDSSQGWEGYPDVPFVPIMEEVDGITIPRLKKTANSVDASGPIATDVGNKAARDTDQPTPGGQIIIRMNAEPKTLNPIGEWNSGRILVVGNHVEHWLNGVRVVSFELHDDAWVKLIEGCKFKNMPGFGKELRGHIALQDHGDET